MVIVSNIAPIASKNRAVLPVPAIHSRKIMVIVSNIALISDKDLDVLQFTVIHLRKLGCYHESRTHILRPRRMARHNTK